MSDDGESCVIDDDGVIHMPDGRAAMLVPTEDMEAVAETVKAVLHQIDYLQSLWSKEGITDGLARRLREAAGLCDAMLNE